MKNVKLNFSFPYATLYGVSNQTASLLRRDLAELAAFHVTEAKVAEFESLLNRVGLSDDAYLGFTTYATHKKNEIRKQLLGLLRASYVHTETLLAANHPILRGIGNHSLYGISDNDLVAKANFVYNLLQEYTDELAPLGFPSTLLDTLKTTADSLQTALVEKQDSKHRRDIATQTRRQEANTLHALLKRYLKIGRTVWMDVDAARYNDYRLQVYRKPKEQTSETDSVGTPENIPASYAA